MSASPAELHGLVAEFCTAEQVTAAARQLANEGYASWDVYGPAPIDELDELVPPGRGRLITAVMVAAGAAGACIGYFYQYWDAVLSYPINVAGHPFNGWPGFVPCAWEICALFTVYAGFFAFCIACGLSRLYHPIFAAPDFERASQDRFFICVETRPSSEGTQHLRALFERHGAERTAELEA
ncbi:MAG TPA: DUF3341 domain-containing protein [Steroidobacteraceae bacterium]|nr:DUF3341 domain-containing protein [Steroidobacteraceae bacterium]